jgi:hypothetical protein
VFCLSDNDILMKLAACDLLDDALASLGLTRADVYVLPTARGQLGRLRRRHGDAVAERLGNILGSVRIIDWPIPPAEQLLFEDAHGIDFGEAALFTATAGLKEFLLATSDKVSLRALVADPKYSAIVQRLAGRVICLEQVVQRRVRHFGFDHVKNKVVPATGYDTALRAIFGSGLLAVQEGVEEGLVSYINDLRSTTGSLLAM